MDIKQVQARSSRSIIKKTCNPVEDAATERAKSTFNVAELAAFVNDGKENILKRQKFAQELERLPWSKKDQRYFLSREQEYVGALRAATQIWMKMANNQLSVDDALLMRAMLDWPGGLELHIGMFIPSILGQATEEQQKELLPKCNSLQIIGTYAQTELGHGTFVRGLETTATFHKDSDQFIIHSPTLTSTKWWPGGLAKTSTHAVVMARLFLDGKDYGPHGFVVQLRDLESHKALPGIEVGDIGPKFGYNGVDNGFLRFDHVLISRSAMLARFAKVTRDGKYIPPPKDNQKASYSTMLFVRADIVQHAARYLAKAACIAVRYCCVRRQTAPSTALQEVQVIDYENTAATLLPLVASSYVMHATGRALWAAYKAYEADRAEGRFSSLPELHAVSSGIKAMTTDVTSAGIEAARRTCGGHGYSVLSGLPTLLASYVQNVTWEGDNNVLFLQTARFVVKSALAMAAGKGPAGAASVEYLHSAGAPKQVSVGDSGWIRDCFVARASYLVHVAIDDVRKHPAAGGQVVYEGEAWNSSTTSLISAARAHCHLVMLDYFANSTRSAAAAMETATAKVLEQLGELWALQVLRDNMGDVLACQALRVEQASVVQQMWRSLLREIRPNAISLVDAWAFTDYELNSALGRQDGDVYTSLLAMAKSSPLNVTDEGPAWASVLKPTMLKLRSKL